ncbi:MAG: hypothetical protein ACR2O6_03095 [Ilumatobacteraceae bacterium]
MADVATELAGLRADIPPGRSGRWRVERFSVPSVEGVETRPRWARDAAGEYTQLSRDNVLFMTDLHAELYTQRVAIEQAWQRGGAVLVTGLGLGLVVDAMLRRPAVDRVVVVEASADVVSLVAPSLSSRHGDRLRVVTADAFAWEPDPADCFTVGWHDIWPVPQDPVAIAEAQVLEERFAGVCDWQASWPAEYLAAEREA